MDLFLWRRTDFRGQRYLPEIWANASPAGFDTILRGLQALATRGGQRTFAARRPTQADDARIHHETDHRTMKPTTKKPYRGEDPEKILRAAGVRVEWLAGLEIRGGRGSRGSTLERRGGIIVLDLDEDGRLELAEACDLQRQGWGNDGCFGSRLSFGLCFAPDWLGVE